MVKKFAVCVTPDGAPQNYYPVVEKESEIAALFKRHATPGTPAPLVFELAQEPEYVTLEDGESLTALAWRTMRDDIQIPDSKAAAVDLLKKGFAFARNKAPAIIQDARDIAKNPMTAPLKHPKAFGRLMQLGNEVKDYAAAASKGATEVVRTARAKLDPTVPGLEIDGQKLVLASWVTTPGHSTPFTPRAMK